MFIIGPPVLTRCTLATYAIGDIQGCFSSLESLLKKIGFTPAKDRLWFVGDLVNRGPQSVEVLRFVKNLGDRAVSVLGNHDLHAIALAAGISEARRSDTLQALLSAPDRDELITWLRHRPLLHRKNNWVLVHAGLLPEWDVSMAEGYAREVEHVLRSNQYPKFLKTLLENRTKFNRWDPTLQGTERLCVMVQAFTKLRVCTISGTMNFSYKGPLEHIPEGLVPWFQVPSRKSLDSFVLFGHWSAMGLRVASNYAALDSGCIWGRHLTALRLEDKAIYQVTCKALLC